MSTAGRKVKACEAELLGGDPGCIGRISAAVSFGVPVEFQACVLCLDSSFVARVSELFVLFH
jgi:hypothetical protein